MGENVTGNKCPIVGTKYQRFSRMLRATHKILKSQRFPFNNLKSVLY